MHVATEVLEYFIRALHDGFRECDPSLAPRDVGKFHGRQCASREMKEAAAKEFGECSHGHDERLFASRDLFPGATIRREPTGRNKQVDVRMPLECARPGMNFFFSNNPTTEKMWIGT